MLLLLLVSFVAQAEDFGFYAMEDREIRLGHGCLPDSVKAKIKENEKSATIQRTLFGGEGNAGAIFEKRYLQLSGEKEIAEACKLEGLQAFFDGKLYQLSNSIYLIYVLSEKDDCGYSVPRVDVTFSQNPFNETFLLGPGFAVLTGKQKEKAERDFKAAKGVEWKFGHPRGYFTRKGDTFMVFDTTEMGTKLSLYRLRGKKAEEVGSAGFEPCGS